MEYHQYECSINLYLFFLIIFPLSPDAEQPPDDFMNDDMDSFLIAMETSELPGPSHVPTSPPHPTNNRKHSVSEDEQEEALTEGPPNKKVQ